MNRTEFIKMCGLLGISIPLHATLTSCKPNKNVLSGDFDGTVLIIGAGAAGLTAGYLLNQQGVDFKILEASSVHGGRMKRTTDFADFPIPLGAEWLHIEEGIFKEIVNDTSVEVNMKMAPYDPNVDYGLFEGEKISLKDVGFRIDQKFINTSWFDFFDKYIVPSVQHNMLYNELVRSIDYTGEQVMVYTADKEFSADKLILTVPVKMLQNKAISFTPELPAKKLEAINSVTVWDGFKAFIEFSEKFYPAVVAFDIQPETAGEKLYYDASHGQNSDRHVLGLFTVGTGTLPYREMNNNDLITYMLNELDEIFDGQASANYVKHISQNWNKEPFIRGAYVNSYEDWRRIRELGKSVDNKLFFAGTAYTTGEDWSSVHTASRSAIRAVRELL